MTMITPSYVIRLTSGARAIEAGWRQASLQDIWIHEFASFGRDASPDVQACVEPRIRPSAVIHAVTAYEQTVNQEINFQKS